MKRIFLLSLSFVSLAAIAQNVKLETGKKIVAVSTTSIDMDMGIGGQMKIESVTTNNINITGTEGDAYKAESAVVKMTMSQEGAGQSMTFDSDKKEDLESEMGQQLGGSLNKPAAILIDKNKGTVTDANPEKEEKEDDGNPFGDLMGGSKGPAASATPAFFVVPSGKKSGDTWTDSTSENGLSVKRNYEFQGVQDGMATIVLKALSKGTVTKEAQGMSMDITLNSTTESTMLTDTKTGLVKSNATKGTMEGTLDMMGQSIPISMTLTSNTTFQ